MNTSTIYFGFKLVVVMIIMFGCSVTRDNFFSRTYHQTTAKYNGFFNANESVKSGVKKIENNHVENYQNILFLNKINQKELPGQVFPNMDRAIEKIIKVITRHSMEINNREKNKWIDDNYFLMAKARFYKKEYLAALNTFKYIIRAYPKSNLVNQALIWSSKCDFRLENIQSAEKTIEYLLSKKGLTEKELSKAHQVQANIGIYRKDYQGAIESLKKSLKKTKDRDEKSRFHFILAQLHERIKKGDEAIENYNKVISLNPKYEMSFRAALNKANSYAFSSGDPSILLKEYNAMLKDEKNKDYRDQIYYALAEIKLNDGDTISAIKAYQNSLQAFLFNVNQKLQTHTKLSKIYLRQKSYKAAYVHYDSIIMLMNIDDDNYVQCKKTYNNLKDVVENQNIIYTEDSLLVLADLTEADRNKKIDDYIEELRQKDLTEKSESQDDAMNGNFNLYEYNKNQANLPITGGWYFYNPTAMSFGYSEFLTRWGNRKNEDNWRRKNKNQIDADLDEEEVVLDGPNEQEKYSRDYYLSQIPLSEEAQKASLKKIENAYYNLGTHLKNKFLDYNLSVDTYEEMLTRFSSTEYKLLVYMQLVFLYDILKEDSAKKVVLKSIEKEFPNNKYINTKTGQILASERDEELTDYEKIYQLYITESYTEALDLINQILEKKQKPEDLNIKMIQAFCISKKEGKKEFINALEQIKKDYPETIQAQKSEEMLDVLYGSFYETETDLYTMTPEAEHYVIITVSDLQIDLPKLQNIISKYNTNNFSEKELTITNLLLNKRTQIIKLAKFKNSKGARNYYESTFNNKEWERFFQEGGLERFIISNKNFITLLKEKKISDYRNYFSEKYLN